MTTSRIPVLSVLHQLLCLLSSLYIFIFPLLSNVFSHYYLPRPIPRTSKHNHLAYPPSSLHMIIFPVLYISNLHTIIFPAVLYPVYTWLSFLIQSAQDRFSCPLSSLNMINFLVPHPVYTGSSFLSLIQSTQDHLSSPSSSLHMIILLIFYLVCTRAFSSFVSRQHVINLHT